MTGLFPVPVCRLPEADGGGRGHHHTALSVPVAARVCAHPASIPAAFPRCPCALPHGFTVKRGHRSLQTGTASRGNYADTQFKKSS